MAIADHEYTPEQRRLLDARLAEAEKGPYVGPFTNGDEIAAFLAWQDDLLDYGQERGKSSGYTEEDVPRLVKEWRREQSK